MRNGFRSSHPYTAPGLTPTEEWLPGQLNETLWGTSASHMRLLLVEDDEGIIRFLEKGLREATYAVDIARDGDDALYKHAINDYDAVIITVPHKDYLALEENYFTGLTQPHGLVADLKGIYRGKITKRNYWSL